MKKHIVPILAFSLAANFIAASAPAEEKAETLKNSQAAQHAQESSSSISKSGAANAEGKQAGTPAPAETQTPDAPFSASSDEPIFSETGSEPGEAAQQQAGAQQRAARTLTLRDAIDTALTYNVDSKIADKQSRIARAEALSSRSPMLPQVNFNASYGVNFDVPYGTSTQTYQGFNAGLRADQLIYDFGKAKSKWRAAQANASVTENNQLATRRAVILSVRSAFFDALEAHALVSVGEKTLENHLRHIAQTQSMVEIGTKPTIDLVKLKSEAAAARASLIQAKGNEQIARAKLSYLIGQTIPAETELAEPGLGALSYESMDQHQLLNKALETRPEFASQRAAIQMRRLQLESTESNLYPALYATAGAGWNWQHITESNLSFDAGLKLTWTIFDGFSNKGARIAAEENLTIEELRLKNQQDQVATALEEATLNISAAISALEALDEAVAAAEALLASAEERYAAGVGNIIELSDSQFDVAEAESKRIRGIYALLSARAALLDAVGVEEWH